MTIRKIDQVTIDGDTLDGDQLATVEATMDSKITTHSGITAAHHVKPDLRSIFSDNIIVNNPTARSTDLSVFTKLKEIRLDFVITGYVRITYEGKRVTAGVAYFTIYKDGVVLGGANNNTSTTYVKYTTDFGPITWPSGTLIQLYARNEGVGATAVQEFNLCYILGYPTTNQDP